MPARPPRFPLARAIAAAALLLAVPLSLGASSRTPLFRWKDGSGAVHYTTEVQQIPEAKRGQAEIVEVAPPAPVRLAQPATPEPAPVPDSELDARIEALERAIADDEAVLADYLSDGDEAQRLRDAGEIDAIAQRLPQRQEELRALRAQRAGGGKADAP